MIQGNKEYQNLGCFIKVIDLAIARTEACKCETMDSQALFLRRNNIGRELCSKPPKRGYEEREKFAVMYGQNDTERNWLYLYSNKMLDLECVQSRHE